ncbi:GntR family transcriptional regulator [Planctomycetes bacterium K23_9]|uniref:HTH-type transcriptional repressor YtrA n=1 Tax=Stieleria marina TaxID=1930275 RepID=A0A517NY15_9BACT|nr:HTH-type transcriptional repressor YtrA [Planctomycetes bacterium K23_9]
MFVSIDVHSDVPIYLQIARQVKFAVAEGTLRSGQLLPSARALSTQWTINPNTVVKAFSILQTDGIIEQLRGRGMVVSRGAAAICRKHRDAEIAQRIGEAIGEAWHAGLEQSKIQSIVDKHLAKLVKIEPAVHQNAAGNE